MGQLSVEVIPSAVSGGVSTPIVVNVRDTVGGGALKGLPVQIGGVTVGLSGVA